MNWRAAVAAALVPVVAGCSAAAAHPAPRSPAAATAGTGAHRHYLGVAAVRVGALRQFEQATGIKPGLAEIYTSFGDPLNGARLAALGAMGVLPLIQMSPNGTPLAGIAAGRYDAYLRGYATGIGHFARPVGLSFAPEMNGDWYSWGCGHTPAAVYVSAWRHIHDVMTRAGARNIIWVWDANHVYQGACPLADRWPGAAYVTWAAVDGYWRQPGDTFATVLAPAITQLRALTGKPVLIAETAARNGPGAVTWIRSLFAGAETSPGVLGIVWFDTSNFRGDYRLEDDPAALAAFRSEARGYR